MIFDYGWPGRDRNAWIIQRAIFDKKLGFPSAFSGVGTFTLHGSLWIYKERGALVSRGQTYVASRGYLYESQDDFLTVRFDDGRPFYSIECSQLPEASFEHICGLDKYIGKLLVGSQGWKNGWQVIGLNKDLKISSDYF